MFLKRTDLAVEAKDIYETERASQTRGVSAKQYTREGCAVTTVRVEDARGSKALGKPEGRYTTIDLPAAPAGGDAFRRGVLCIAEELRPMLPPREDEAPVLVVGLGNRAITPDAIGPLAVERLLITRHLRRVFPEQFGQFTPVCAVATGVLGDTGMESAEVARGAAERVQPCCVIVIDALMARRMERLCTTVQVSDTGLIPGSGIGNHRMALNASTLGVPVLSVGVPTVIEAATAAADLLEDAGISLDDDTLRRLPERNIVVTPKDIDARVNQLSKTIGYAITMALQPSLSFDDITSFLT